MKETKLSETKIKLVLDIVMVAVLLLLYQKNAVSMAFHEIAGLGVFALLIVHNLLNGRWILAVTSGLLRKDAPAKPKVLWLVNLLLGLSLLGITVTGLMIAKTLPFRLGQIAGAKQWHYFCSALSILLLGVHLGLHWQCLGNFIRRQSPTVQRVCRIGGTLLLVFALVFGGCRLVSGSFTRWLVGPFSSTAFRDGEMPDFDGEKPDFDGEKPDFDGNMPEQNHKGGNRKPDSLEGKMPDRQEGKPSSDNEMKQNGNDTEQSENRPKGMPNRRQGQKGGILQTIVTYGSEVTVFAFITALLAKPRKKKADAPAPDTPAESD